MIRLITITIIFIIVLLSTQTECTSLISEQARQDIFNKLNDGSTHERRKIFRYSYKGEPCLEEPIHRCSCVEMLYGIKDLNPKIPDFDEQDIKTRRRASMKFYHPDKTPGVGNEPVQFLNLCAIKLTNPTKRKSYLDQLKFGLESYEKRNYPDSIRRDFIEDLNNKVIIRNENISHIPFEKREFEKEMETLYIFLDNSGSMTDDRLNKAKEYIKGISGRLYASNTNVYFIGSKDKSRQIVTHYNRINEHTLESHILDIWKAEDGATYLWEFVWESMKDNTCADCELIIVTDGEDNMSSGKFYGSKGFDELMIRLKQRQQPLPRVYVYCIGCTVDVEKYYQELAIGAGGYFCSDENADECCDIINSPHCDRVKLQHILKGKYYELLEGNEIRQIPWMDNRLSTKEL
jgi:hypothetical protein